MAEKLLEEVNSMGESIRLQCLQMQSMEYVLKRAIEKIDKKIEELCRVQFGVLEKITELKCIENQIKALSECVDNRTKMEVSESSSLRLSEKESEKLPGRSPTPGNGKNRGLSRIKDKKPPQRLSEGEMSGEVSENEKGMSMAHFLVKHSISNPMAPSQAKDREKNIKWSRVKIIQMEVANKKREDSIRVKNQVCSRDAVCFMHKKVSAWESQVQEPIGDHLFQCEHG